MTLPCEQFDASDPFGHCRKCLHYSRTHDLASAIRAEQAEALAAKDRENAALRATVRSSEAMAESLRSDAARAEAQVATLTARVTALEKWVQEVGHPDDCASVGIADEGDGQIVRYSSGTPCDCGLCARLTKEPTT